MSLSQLKIDSLDLRQQWRSPTVDPWLRVVVLVASMLFCEQGAKYCRLISLLGDGSSKYGRGASLSVLSLPGVRRAGPGCFHKRPKWIVDRINVLFPFGDGPKETATYDGEAIHIEVPFYGYAKECMALRDLLEWGPKTRTMRPRKIRMIEP